jgi:hypothetical protein
MAVFASGFLLGIFALAVALLVTINVRQSRP